MPSALVKVKSKEFYVEVGDVLFNSLEEQKFTLNHGCLSGSCGACQMRVVSGMEFLDDPGAIEQDTIKAVTKEQNLKGTIRLTCRAKVIAPGTIILE